MYDMARQLVLLDPAEPDWQLDDRTKEVGRQGIAEARAVLRRAVAADDDRRALAS
jgi:hypothetical protein